MQMTTAEIVHVMTLPSQAAREYVRECNMDSDERERLLYITGRTAEAALLSQNIEDENDALDELRHERDGFKEDADKYERENDNLQAAVEAAEEKVLTLTSELENAQDEIKALQSEIREKCLDLL